MVPLKFPLARSTLGKPEIKGTVPEPLSDRLVFPTTCAWLRLPMDDEVGR